MNTIIEEIRAWVERQLKNTHDWLNGKGAKKGSPRYYKMRGRESAFDFVLSILSDLEKSEKHDVQDVPAKKNCHEDEVNEVLAKIDAETLSQLRDTEKSEKPKKGLHSGSLRKVDNPMKWMEEDAKELTNSAIQEQPVKTNIVEDLKHYLATTPKEQIKKDWESLKEWDKVGPSVSEFLGWKQPVCEDDEKYVSILEGFLNTCWGEYFLLHEKEDFQNWIENRLKPACKEQPVCEGLEEAAEISFDEANTLTEDYLNFLAKGLKENHPRPIGPHWFCEYAKNRFIAGAKWQKAQSDKELSEKIASAYQLGLSDKEKQMMKDGLDAIKSGQSSKIEKTIAGVFVKYGMDKQKEQMLKNAVEGYISATNEVSAVLALPKGDFKKGDKVNLLFVKKD